MTQSSMGTERLLRNSLNQNGEIDWTIAIRLHALAENDGEVYICKTSPQSSPTQVKEEKNDKK